MSGGMTGGEQEGGTPRARPAGSRRPGHIVVGVDGSPGAAWALDWAGSEAERAGAPLTVVVAWSFGGFTGAITKKDDAHDLVRGAEARLAAQHAGVTVDHVLSEQPASYALIEASRGADLLVVGSRGLGGFRDLLLGSVGQHCLTHAPCSVAVIRAPEAPVPAGWGDGRGRIVVGVDGSEGSGRALDWAIDEARRSDARIDVVSSWVFPGTAGFVYSVDVGIPDRASHVVDGAVDHVAATAPGLVVGGRTTEDPPAVALVEASRTAQLLVVGSRGLGAFAGLLLGSVGHNLAIHAHCPLVVVRSADRA